MVVQNEKPLGQVEEQIGKNNAAAEIDVLEEKAPAPVVPMPEEVAIVQNEREKKKAERERKKAAAIEGNMLKKYYDCRSCKRKMRQRKRKKCVCEKERRTRQNITRIKDKKSLAIGRSATKSHKCPGKLSVTCAFTGDVVLNILRLTCNSSIDQRSIV